MKKLVNVSLILLLFVFVSSCKKDDDGVDLLSLLDSIPAQEYYQTDIFQNQNAEINGTWKALNSWQSGVAGVFEVPIDFDYLLIKPNAIFGITRSNELVTSGSIDLIEENPSYMVLKFNSEIDSSTLDINLLEFDQVPSYLSADSLRLIHGTGHTILIRED